MVGVVDDVSRIVVANGIAEAERIEAAGVTGPELLHEFHVVAHDALNALFAGYRHDYKRQVDDPARLLAAKPKTVNTALKSTETEFLKTNPNVLNELFKSAGIQAAAPPPQN